jgi:sterol desaturase/sphingolipid hydroxylase (fatty acid hydroxylase superfamily)
MNHHYYTDCNFGLWGFMDRLFNTKRTKERFPIDYVPSYERVK